MFVSGPSPRLLARTRAPSSGICAHFVVVDVLKRRLTERGVRVDHLVGGRASAFENEFRLLGIGLPDGWVTASKERPDVAALLPGTPAIEIHTAAAPLLWTSQEAREDRCSLAVNAAAPKPYALVDEIGRLIGPSEESDNVGAPTENDLRALNDLDELGARGILAPAFRLHCLTTHYRRRLAFSHHFAEAQRRHASKARRAGERVAERAVRGRLPRAKAHAREFEVALDNDANGARAITAFVAMLTDLGVSPSEKRALGSRMDAVLGLALVETTKARSGRKEEPERTTFQRVA